MSSEPTFTPPLCDDGNPAPTVAGCPDEPTFTPPLCSDGNPAPTVNVDVQTVMEASLHPYAQMVTQHQQSWLDVQTQQTIPQPLCDDGNPAPTAGWMSRRADILPTLCDDGNQAPTVICWMSR